MARLAQYFLNCIAAACLIGAVLSVILGTQKIYGAEFAHYDSDIIATQSAMIGALASVSGVLIAAFMISSQLGARRPYSRLSMTFRGFGAWYPFFYLFNSLLFSLFVLVALPRLPLSWVGALDGSVLLFIGAMCALGSLMLRSFLAFNSRSLVDAVLSIFTARSVRHYGLVEVSTNSNGIVTSVALRTWGHRHNLSDPLGPFHDLLMEAVTEKERVTLHLYVSRFSRRIAVLNGVLFQRTFTRSIQHGVGDLDIRRPPLDFLLAISRPSLPISLEITAHALHYIVRRSRKLVDEWSLDTHRQIITINLADLIISLCARRDAARIVDVCLDAIVRINYDYRSVKPHGPVEPVHGLFALATALHDRGLHEPSNRLLRALAFLDCHTSLVTKSKLTPWEQTAESIPPEVLAFFRTETELLEGKDLQDAFPATLWPD